VCRVSSHADTNAEKWQCCCSRLSRLYNTVLAHNCDAPLISGYTRRLSTPPHYCIPVTADAVATVVKSAQRARAVPYYWRHYQWQCSFLVEQVLQTLLAVRTVYSDDSPCCAHQTIVSRCSVCTGHVSNCLYALSTLSSSYLS
jgi:hypothetical protein